MKNMLVLTLLAVLLLTACGGAAEQVQEKGTGTNITVYYSPT